jgi:N-acetylmuramoyl-L-alanine amidase
VGAPRVLAVAVAAVCAAAAIGCGGGATGGGTGASTAAASRTTAPANLDPGVAATTRPAAAPPTRPPAGNTSAPMPRIVQRPIPFGARRKTEMTAYARRHYGLDTYRLRSPHVIVEHYTATSTFQAAWNTFAQDVPDSELHELPGTCSHFIIDSDGTIYQLVPLGIMCRHTVGLNYTAFGIEHVGNSDGAVLGNPAVLSSSLRLTRWLMCRYGIERRNVIGHNESLSSPYHMERIARLRNQTHDDMRRASMNAYRAKLAKLPGC